MSPINELLAEFTEILTRFGPDSEEASEYIERNQFNDEFVELAELSRDLKKALTAPGVLRGEQV